MFFKPRCLRVALLLGKPLDEFIVGDTLSSLLKTRQYPTLSIFATMWKCSGQMMKFESE